MLKGLTILPALALVGALALPQAAVAAPDADTVVARVDGTDITLGHMIIAYATLPQQYKQVPPAQLYPAILDQLIQQVALQHAFEGEVPKHVALSLENEERSLIAAAEIENVMASAASESDLRAAYDEKYADGFGGDEFNASHILVATEEEATALKTALTGGADFAEMAKEKSTGPSGPNGGELGWFGLGAMVPEFEAAVVGMQPGDVSDPVQTQFGWHVIKLNEARKAEAPSFEEAQGELANELRQKAVEERILELTAAAEVERPEIEGLDASVLLNLDMVQN